MKILDFRSIGAIRCAVKKNTYFTNESGKAQTTYRFWTQVGYIRCKWCVLQEQKIIKQERFGENWFVLSRGYYKYTIFQQQNLKRTKSFTTQTISFVQ